MIMLGNGELLLYWHHKITGYEEHVRYNDDCSLRHDFMQQ